jgi:hypothetical protein
MATTRDGLRLPYPPDPKWLGIGAVMILGGVGVMVSGVLPGPPGIGAGLAGVMLGLLVLINQRGVKRIRATNSKLLVENERLIRGFLIGPRKERISWGDITGLTIEGDALRVDTAAGPQHVARGASPEDLAFLKQKIEFALDRFRR